MSKRYDPIIFGTPLLEKITVPLQSNEGKWHNFISFIYDNNYTVYSNTLSLYRKSSFQEYFTAYKYIK